MSDLPDPLAGEARVDVHPGEPTLIVRPLESASYGALLWRKAHRRMLRDEETGRSAASVYAQAPGHSDIARGAPDRDGSLRFKFRAGDPVFRELSKSPSLAAIFTVDRREARIWSVRFNGR